jgi:hypothetical protein
MSGPATDRMPTPILGPTGDLVQADVDPALARVAGGAATPAAAWQAVLEQAAAAARCSLQSAAAARCSLQAAAAAPGS